MIILWSLLALVAVVLAVSYVCFRMAFYVPKSKPSAFNILDTAPYIPYRDTMRVWREETEKIPHREFCITSFDGLKLYGNYYECDPGAPIELMMHGYRGNAERDLCGGVQRCFALGRNALIVDQRACGRSEGRVITFGVREQEDCRAWVDFMIETFGEQVKIVLCGISMGASTVLMAAGKPLPQNVIGVLCDCGYTSAREIICSVIRGMHLPPRLCYPFVRLGARIFGGFDPNDADAFAAAGKCTLPVFFAHGEGDDFVPCEMSRKNYAAIPGRKHLFTVPDAAHGLAYMVDPDGYVSTLREFKYE